MASSGKKSRKKPSYHHFDWSEEVDRTYNVGPYVTTNTSLPTAPRSAREPQIDESKIPQSGPFQAYVSNIPYDIGDSELAKFFESLNVKNVRIAKDDNKRAKGYGYVEFDDRESLISALHLNDQMLHGRQIHVEVSSNDNGGRGRQGGSRGRQDIRQDMGGQERSTMSNWRSQPRNDEIDRRDFGSTNNFKRNDRGYSRDDRGSGGNDRRYDKGGGFNRNYKDDESYSDNNRYRRNDGRDKGNFGGRRNDYNYKKNDDRSDAPQETNQEVTERPKLQLQPRSVTKTETVSSNPNPSIFGLAKPVDTAAKDLEIERRLQEKEGKFDLRDTSEKSYDSAQDNRSRVTSSDSGDWKSDGADENSSNKKDQVVLPTQPKESAWSRNKSNPPTPAPLNNGRTSPEEDNQIKHEQNESSTKQSLDDDKRTNRQERKPIENKKSLDESKGNNKTVRSSTGANEKSKIGRETHEIKQQPLLKQRDVKKEEDNSKFSKFQDSQPPDFLASNKFMQLHESDED